MRRNRKILIVMILSALLGSGLAAYAQDNPTPPADVDVTVHQDGTDWAVSPVWLAIGGIALLALISLIVAASRGNRGQATTIVKE